MLSQSDAWVKTMSLMSSNTGIRFFSDFVQDWCFSFRISKQQPEDPCQRCRCSVPASKCKADDYVSDKVVVHIGENSRMLTADPWTHQGRSLIWVLSSFLLLCFQQIPVLDRLQLGDVSENQYWEAFGFSRIYVKAHGIVRRLSGQHHQKLLRTLLVAKMATSIQDRTRKQSCKC